MIRFLIDCLLWSLGFERRGETTSSGFGSDQLLPARRRSAAEAVLRAASSALFVAACFAQFMPEELAKLHDPSLHLLAMTGAAWCLLMLMRPSLPMDSTAIGTGLWSFAGYLPYFLIGNLFAVPISTLLGHAGLVGGVLSYGLFRDIRREIRAEKP